VARAGRAQGLDVVSALELDRRGLTDDAQLFWAAEQGRCLVTRDIHDFPELALRFAANQWPHAGVAIVPRSIAARDVGGIVRALHSFTEIYEEGLPRYTVTYLTTLTPH
jgi:hypothetical protein